jgi:phosphohistidine phosphatase
MKRVYLLRHAKSSWKLRGVPDHDRPLAPRGRRAAKAIARHMREQGIEPELVLCSTARRARETLERIEPVLGTPVVRFESELYGASAGSLLDRLRDVRDAVGTVLLIGHNPAVQLLALDLARPAPEVRELEAKFPTAGLATLVFPGSSWRALAPGTAELAEFVRPRDLER